MCLCFYILCMSVCARVWHVLHVCMCVCVCDCWWVHSSRCLPVWAQRECFCVYVYFGIVCEYMCMYIYVSVCHVCVSPCACAYVFHYLDVLCMCVNAARFVLYVFVNCCVCAYVCVCVCTFKDGIFQNNPSDSRRVACKLISWLRGRWLISTIRFEGVTPQDAGEANRFPI